MSISDVIEDAGRQAPWQEDLYKQLHANPELSHCETATCTEISSRLSADGYEVVEAGGGVVGILRNGDGPTVLFRADIDALPVREATGLSYASTKTMKDADGVEQPVMHACGHDMHITAGLGAAHVLAEHKDAWSGTYLALFQPAEETSDGARTMLADDLVAKLPKPDVAFAQHVLTAPEAGKVGYLPAAFLSTAASLRVTVYGTGSHGSMPHLGVDPVVLASSIVMRLQTIVSREIDPFQMAVVTVGSLQAGTKANIIPAEATLLINIRAFNEDVRVHLLEAIERIVRDECAASRSPKDPEIEVYESYPLTLNDPDVTARVVASMKEALGDENVVEIGPQTASEDFSDLPNAWSIPYCYWGVGGFTPGQKVLPNHNPGFAPAIQPTLTTGTKAVVAAVLAYLGKDADAAGV